MPKKSDAGATSKKARWTPAEKKARAAAAARSPKNARRTERDGERRERFDRRDGDDRGARRHPTSRPATSGTAHVGGREWRAPRDEHRPARREDGGFERRDDRRDDRFDRRGPRSDERRGGDRWSDSRDGRWQDSGDRWQGRRPEDRRGDREASSRFERRYDDRPQRRDDRGGRSFDRRDDRGGRSFDRRDDRGGRSFDRRDDRGGRSFDRRDDRGHRGFDRRDERSYDDAPRSFEDAEAERLEADSWTKAVRTPVSEGPVEVAEDNGFAALGLPERVVERLARDGITTPFPIQSATIPDALSGRDVLGRGQTGSGKTLAFGLPMIARLLEADLPRESKRPHALVLVPTRELAMQVSDALEPLVHVAGLRHKLVAGGLSYTTQINALNKGIDILIATPGRLNDLLERGAVEMDSVRITVLDEADHMAEMGFMAEITTILDRIPAESAQRLLFSATLDNGIEKLVERYLTDPIVHSTDDATASVETMEHHVLLISPSDKKVITAEVANRPGRTVVFCRTKLGADRVAAQLREQGVLAAALHGGLAQGARNRVLGAFRDGTLPVLVATDVAARGIHVDDVSVVLQVDPPADHKDYLHRSGRTARAGDKGTVVTLALPHQRKTMERQLREAGLDISPVKAHPGDAVIEAAGGSTPQGAPISDEDFQRLLAGPKDHRRGPAGSRGPRHGSHGSRGSHGSHGGSRPHHGGHRGRDSRDGRRGRDDSFVTRWGDDERPARRGSRF